MLLLCSAWEAHAAEKRVTRSKDEVLKLIETASRTKPDWWDDVPLEYPETLDLSFAPGRPGDWNPQRNLGHYMWSIVNENPRRYRQGTKLMHYVLVRNRNNARVAWQAAQQLGHCYHNLLQDWARAAFWKRQIEEADASLANCYWQLGSKEMATDVLRNIRVDDTKFGAVIKLWSEVGELETALELAEASARRQDWGGAWRAAGDACRKHRQYGKAVAYYKKVLAMPRPRRWMTWGRNQEHAKASIESIKIYETFDIKLVADGTYRDKCQAYNGELHVSVTVKDHRITDVKVTRFQEKQYYASLTEIPRAIIERQDFRGVDATTGATVTADAIKNAVAHALRQGVKRE
jgi:uncharacterized protein with FMN-binding domain